MINILVSNDDGINAAGIRALVMALSDKANVYVCAPDGQRSGNSQSITLNDLVYIHDENVEGAKKAWSCSGTPADCVKMGLQLCDEIGVDIQMVFAGINMGSNLGKDTLYSGTVGAAKEAALAGYQSVAVSVDGHNAQYFKGACKLAKDMIELVYEKFSPDVIMNINVPDIPIEKIQGVKFTRLGPRYYKDRFWKQGDKADNGYKLDGVPEDFDNLSEEYDVWAIQNGYASITPLHFDYTDHIHVKEIEKWQLKMEE